MHGLQIMVNYGEFKQIKQMLPILGQDLLSSTKHPPMPFQIAKIRQPL